MLFHFFYNEIDHWTFSCNDPVVYERLSKIMKDLAKKEGAIVCRSLIGLSIESGTNARNNQKCSSRDEYPPHRRSRGVDVEVDEPERQRSVRSHVPLQVRNSRKECSPLVEILLIRFRSLRVKLQYTSRKGIDNPNPGNYYDQQLSFTWSSCFLELFVGKIATFGRTTGLLPGTVSLR